MLLLLQQLSLVNFPWWRPHSDFASNFALSYVFATAVEADEGLDQDAEAPHVGIQLCDALSLQIIRLSRICQGCMPLLLRRMTCQWSTVINFASCFVLSPCVTAFCKKAILKVTKGMLQSYVSMMVNDKPKLLVSISQKQHARLHGDILVRILRNYVAKAEDVPAKGGCTLTIRTELTFDALKAQMRNRRDEWLEHIADLEKENPKTPVVLIAQSEV